MAITRAQQARQLYKNGGSMEDIGFSIAKPSKNGSRPGYRRSNYDDSGGGFDGPNTGKSGGPDTPETGGNAVQERNIRRAEEKQKAYFNSKEFKESEAARKVREKIKRNIILGKEKMRSITLPNGKVVKTRKTPNEFLSGLYQMGNFFSNPLGFVAKKQYEEYKDNKLNKAVGINPEGIDYAGSDMGFVNSLNKPEETVEREGDNFIDIMADNNPVYDEEFTPYEGGEIAKLIAERDKNEAYRFMAEGGRAAFQEGGIMPRLNQLGSGISSAEQMLQGINQKLESAESNLGEGESDIGSSPFGRPLFDEDGFRLGDQRYGTGLVDGPKMTLPSLLNQTSEGPIQSPLADAMRNTAANNGRAALAEGGMPYEGGIMDLESGRQQYFLGKLVKKAKRAIGKITKSKAGKAALLGLGAYGFNNFGGFKGIGEGFGKGFNFLKEGYDNIDMDGKDKFSLLAAAGLTAAPLLFQDDEEDPDFTSNRGPGLNIEELRKNPYATMGGAYRFYADGGEVEPVAKETMPLLDMNNQEMDLRAEGGFVPIGRMEKADDVPARLSKNEFVFTADAVRNAGEGDIDKGAEVMYNMMKNLESGGEVSEESQGLNGAKEMFQTSKRLEEVL